MWRKEGADLVWDAVEQGIAPSPLKGTANIQNANISTELGEVMASYARFKQDQEAIVDGTLTPDGDTLFDAPANLQAGDWITVSASDVPSVVSEADFLIVAGGGGGGGATASEASGGGGAGGFLEDSFTPSIGTYAVTVGAGGTGGASGEVGINGGASYIGNAASQDFWVLVAAGGAGGGTGASGTAGGGGGAGGLVEDATYPLAPGVYSITVGSGGAAQSDGSSSSLGSEITTVGGGAGAGENGGASTPGSPGGSGGGGNAINATATSGGGAGTTDQGHSGGTGNCSTTGTQRHSGGGGGAGGAGGNGDASTSGAAGAGVSSSISGSAVTYAAGGAGASQSSGNGAAGTANRGNGGGGSGGVGTTGGAGGSGVVIVRFPTGSITVVESTGASSSSSGGDTILTWTTSGVFSFTVPNQMYAQGGGGGATINGRGQDGGSGGGGASGTVLTAGQGYSGQGNDGGTGAEGGGTNEAGGGGGGAGASGSNASAPNAGNGGNGSSSSISGASVTYAGGGGGGSINGTAGTGGSGGGGTGSVGADPVNGTNGLGGGGGGNAGDTAGGDGGSGIVIISYATGTMTASGGAITFSGGNTIHTFTTNGTFTVYSVATAGQYFVSYKDTNDQIKLSGIFDPYGLYPIVHGTTGTVTFSTLATVNKPLSKATEKYSTDDSTEYRYYILDANGYVWVYDTLVYQTTLTDNGVGEAWMLPDPTDYSAEEFNSIAILNGWLVALNNSKIQGKPTTDLGRAFVTLQLKGDNLQLINPFPTHTNFAYVGHQGKMYYCDGSYLGQVQPNNQFATSLVDVQSFCSFTGSGTTGTITAVISGSSPSLFDESLAPQRLPIVFFASQTGAVPVGITEGTVYWALISGTNARQFTVYESDSGGSPITITTAGTETYFNTFYPLGEQQQTDGTAITIFQFAPQRLNLPTFETAQCMVEIGLTLLIGGITNTLYPWNQQTNTPQDLIALPESDVKTMINVNNTAIVFAGNKGNIYISNTSQANLLLKVPDYCAGVPGVPQTYTEPVFTWGDAIYLRGRVFFSILDQSSVKAGNCGGVWSFIPSSNFFYGQDTGLALRLENQNSYGDYNGYAPILIAAENQLTAAAVDADALAPQFWAAWQDSYSTATSSFGIDFTNTIPATTVVVETDLVKTGTLLDKSTFINLEYKVSSPLQTDESLQLYWRLNGTAAWTSAGTVIEETADRISGYWKVNFQKGQWLQLRAVMTTSGLTTSSFTPLVELRVR